MFGSVIFKGTDKLLLFDLHLLFILILVKLCLNRYFIKF